jgi:hypothetical protein
LLEGINDQKGIDDRAINAFRFKDAERVLIEDLFNYTLPDFQDDHRSLGRQQTQRNEGHICEPQLFSYCEYFVRVLKAGFGHNKSIHATIFQEAEDRARAPYRLTAFELGGTKNGISTLRIKVSQLLTQLDQLGTKADGSIYRNRVARVYETLNDVPTVFLIKPDMRCYWTRSAALNDADEAASDLFNWAQIGSEVA